MKRQTVSTKKKNNLSQVVTMKLRKTNMENQLKLS